MKNRAVNALVKMGMPTNIKGFRYIADAMLLFENKEYRNGQITPLYQKIAEMNNTTASRVERAIRHAFGGVLTNGVLAEVEKYLTFHNTTNGNLLHVFYIRLEQES